MKHSTPLFVRLAALAAFLPALAFAADDAAQASAPAYSKKGADTCLGCHDDEVVLAVFHGKHGQPNDPRSPFGKGQLQCEACHGPAGTTPSASRRARRGRP